VIDALAHMGIVSGSYDGCELWEVASMLGANRPPEPEESTEADAAEKLRAM
jgi:hypothetical protein